VVDLTVSLDGVNSFPTVVVALPGLSVDDVASAVAAEQERSVVRGPDRCVIEEWDRVLSGADGSVVVATATSLESVEVRRSVRDRAVTVWIDDPRSTVQPAMKRRFLGPLTTVADVLVEVDHRPGHLIAEEVVAALARVPPPAHARYLTESVTVDGGRSYAIHVGRGARELVSKLVPDRARRVAVLTQDGIGVDVETGREQQTFVLPAGEGAKTLSVVEDLCSRFARWGMTRGDTVVTVGGGVVSDVGGFVAASYHRGVPVVHVSTTLLGQIDAAIGGKCGVNLAEGKNLVGAFWQPMAVVCEIEALDTLPRDEFVAGMGELAKYHFLGGGRLDRLPLVERVAAAARIKAEIVSADEREGGRRAILNYGHTLAHALETASGYRIRHGEAVALGLVYAAEVAHRLDRIDQARVDEHRRVVTGYGLSTSLAGLIDRYPVGPIDVDQLLDLFSRDKKAVDGVTFVLDGPDGVETVRVNDREVLADALDRVGRP
jgi:5-deoxy-5-amino-3-dehydroquinate synthase